MSSYCQNQKEMITSILQCAHAISEDYKKAKSRQAIFGLATVLKEHVYGRELKIRYFHFEYPNMCQGS